MLTRPEAKRRLRSAPWWDFPLPGQLRSPRLNVSPEKMSHGQSKEVRLPEMEVNDPPTNELNASSPARPAVVAASAEVRVGTDGASAKTAFRPSPTAQIRTKHSAQTARHKNFVSSSRAPQHPPAPRTDPNAFQRFWAGLTTAIEHVWPLATSAANRTSRLR
jgi:hypothetical protein